MKRIGNLYEQICSVANLEMADEIACKGKSRQYGVKLHIKKRKQNILKLHELLIAQAFVTSPYKTFTIYQPKERVIFSLPYYPDRIVHHAVMLFLEPIFTSVFTADTYSSIKGKGIHAAANAVKEASKDEANTTYCSDWYKIIRIGDTAIIWHLDIHSECDRKVAEIIEINKNDIYEGFFN